MYGIIRVFHQGRVVFTAPAENVKTTIRSGPDRCKVWVDGLPNWIEDIPCTAGDMAKALMIAQRERDDYIDIGRPAPDA